MSETLGLPFDLNTYEPHTDGVAEYVVLRGFQPGCTDKSGMA